MRLTVTVILGGAVTTAAIRSSISAQPGPGGQVDEELAVALRPEDRRGDDVAGPEAERRGAATTTRSRTSRWMAGSRTTPWSVRPLPASNCGLTRATIGAAGREGRDDRPEDLVERDERDVDRRRGRSARAASSAVSVRALVRSMRRRRAGRGEATRRAVHDPRRERRRARAPRCNRTSVKPPVDAPTSRPSGPAGSIPKASSAAASLWPPRLTYGSGCVDDDRRRRVDQVAGLAVESRARRPRRPGPCRPGRAPGPGCASRPARARRAAGRAACRVGLGGVAVEVRTRLSWHSPLHRDSPRRAPAPTARRRTARSDPSPTRSRVRDEAAPPAGG